MNETLEPEQMDELLVRYYRLVRPGRKPYKLLRQGDRSRYQSFIMAIDRLEDEGRSWVAYTHAIFPAAPAGFEWIGRMANAPKKQIEPSPRLWALPIPQEAKGFLK